jgi:phage replication-related protein YjqB (UPF0714/DUF867 family)
MVDRYSCFADLAAEQREGRDYGIVCRKQESPVAVIAPHGGTIEPTTSEIAMAIAGDTHSLYCFEGLIPARPHAELHITSERFDEPSGRDLVAAAEFAVAVHGRKDGDDAESVWLGGRDDVLAGLVGAALVEAGFRVQFAVGKLEGKGVRNICNAGRRGAGVQLELPRTLRDVLRADRARLGAFATAVRRSIDRHLTGLELRKTPS